MREYSVLVVDDEPDIRQVVGDILQDEGYVVHVAANAAEALDKIHTYHDGETVLPYPRVIIFDDSVSSRTSSEGAIIGVDQRELELWFWFYVPADAVGVDNGDDQHAYVLDKIGNIESECLALTGRGEPIAGRTHLAIKDPTMEGAERELSNERTDVDVDVHPDLSLWKALITFGVG